jgi:hypothetical protein
MKLQSLAELPAFKATSVFVDLPNITTRAFAAGIRRPDWSRVLSSARTLFGSVEGFVFVNELKIRPTFFAFARKLQSAAWGVRYCSRLLEGFDQKDPVDSAIQSRIAELSAEPSFGKGLVLMTHDGGYAPYVAQCLAHNVPVIVAGFGELLSPKLVALKEHGAQVADLEYDFAARATSGARPSGETLSRMGLRLAA